MVQSFCLCEKVAKKMCNSTNSEVIFDDEFSVDGILVFEEKRK